MTDMKTPFVTGRALVVMAAALLAWQATACAPEPGAPESGGETPLRTAVQAAEDIPSVDLDGVGGLDNTADFTEGTAVDIAPDATVTDTDDIASMTVTLTNRPDGDTVESLSATDSGGVTCAYTTGTGVLLCSGDAAASVYQTVLQSVSYDNTSEDPDETDRSITTSVTDVEPETSVTRTTTLSVTAENDAPTVDTNAGLTVAEGAEGDIDTTLLDASDVDTDDVALVFTVDTAPANGTLKLDGAALVNGNTFTQQDIVDDKLTYEHDGGETTSDSFVFDLNDEGAGPQDQTFSITITAVDDPTVVDTNAGLTVDEGAEGTIGTAALSASDEDADDVQIVFTVDTAPANGTLKLDGAALGNGDTFTQQDIVNDDLSYEHDGGETTSDSFVFDLVGGGNAGPQDQTFSITVNAIDDPTVVDTNAGLTVAEEAEGTIGTAALSASDEDADDVQIVFTVDTAPANGTLKLDGATLNDGDTFTQQDIVDNKLTYEHDGTENFTDSFVFDLVGGGNAGPQDQTFSITITEVNDPPVIDANAGLNISEGDQDQTIDNTLLATSDEEQGAANITYTVTALPSFGVLQVGGADIGQDGTFTQQDVDNDLLNYDHGNNNETADSFVFDVSDGNTSIDDQTFNITIAQNNDPPTLDVNAGLTVNEDDQNQTIGTAALSASDDEQGAADITFTITTAPQHGALQNQGATLDANDSFTQDDLANNRINYDHGDNEETADSFVFTLSDGTNTIAGQTFSITINAVNDPPTLTNNNTLTVAEGAEGDITQALLRGDDNDNANNEIEFVVTAVTNNGELRNNGVALANDDRFSQADVNAGRITYAHAGDEAFTDSFTFDLTDGADTLPGQTFDITITPVNDPPEILTLNQNQGLNEGDSFTFSATAQDPEGDDLEFTWVFGDGNTQSDEGLDSVSNTYVQDGNFTLTLTVSDGNLEDNQTLAVFVANVVPQNVAINGGELFVIDEGTTLDFSASGNDPGAEDTLEFCWDFDGDGNDDFCNDDDNAESFRFDDGTNTFLVRLTVSDDDASVQDTAQVVVNNVPPVANAGNNQVVDEGTAVNFNGTITDASNADQATLTFEWDFGDGNTNDQDIDPTHTYADDNFYTAELTVTDKDNASDDDSVSITVRNVAPTIVFANNNITADEGDTVTFEATVTDPGADELTFEWDFGDGNTQNGNEGDDLSEVTHTYDTPDTYTARLTVTDDDGGSTTRSLTVTIDNVQPTADVLVIENEGDEGEELVFQVSASEPGTNNAADLDYDWNFGDGTVLTDGDLRNVTHTYRDEGDGDFTVTVTIDDGDGDPTIITRTIDINNVPPVANAGNDATIDEGTTFTFDGSATDQGLDDVLEFFWDFDGDGNNDQNAVNLRTPQFFFADNTDSEDVRLIVQDNDGDDSAPNFVTITVNNVAPTVDLGNNRTVNQGQQFNVGSVVVDPGENNDNDEQLNYAWVVTCDAQEFPGCSGGVQFEGNNDEGEDLTDIGLTLGRTRDQAGFYTLTLTVTDKDGASGSDSIQIDVQNEVPIVDVEVNNATINEGQSTRVTTTAEDAPDDTLTVNIDFGDGQDETVNNHQFPYDDIVRNHTYAQEGNYTINVVATDLDGGQGNNSVGVTVRNVPPAVTLDNFNGQEGVQLDLDADVSDVAADTARLVFTWDFGDGDTQQGQPGQDLSEVSHTYEQDGEYTLQLSVFDGTDTTTQTSTVTIANVRPVVTFNNFNANEGQEVLIQATAVDVAADTLRFEWDFRDGNTATTNVPQVRHTFADGDDSFNVRLRVFDDDQNTTETATATVANLDPVVEAIDDITEDEGETLTFTAEATDVADDTLTYCWDLDNGAGEQCGVDLTEIEVTYNNDDTRNITVTVSDEDGGENDQSFSVTFDNLPPTDISAGDDINGQNEGTAVTFDGSARDPGNDVITYCWNFGDGTDEFCEVGASSPSHTYTDEDNYIVEMFTLDDEGARSVSDFVRVEVGNVAPTVVLQAQPPVDEGESFTLRATATEPGNDTLTFCWTLGDGTAEVCREPNQDVTQGTTTDTFEYAYGDNGIFDVQLRVIDDDLAQGSDSIDVRSNNVAPDIANCPDDQNLFAFTDVEFSFDLQVADPGTDDEFTFQLIRGHPNATIATDGELTFTPQELDGQFEFLVRVTDDDGAFGECTFDVSIGFEDDDNDGAPDVCELGVGADCMEVGVDDGDVDFDNDGLTSAQECLVGKNPCESNAPSPAPSIHLPRDNDVVSVEPVILTANNNTIDPDGDEITYTFELFSDRQLQQAVGQPIAVTQAPPRTSATVAVDLDENGEYCWRVTATDGDGFSEPSIACFIFSLIDEPPASPSAQEPLGVVRNLRPRFRWANGGQDAALLDPERRPVSYTLQVLEDDQVIFTSPEPIPPGEGGLTVFEDLPVDILEDDTEYSWRVQASDGQLTSPFSTLDFVINLADDRPGPIAFLFPEENFILDDPANFTVVSTKAIDPDGDEPTYDFDIVDPTNPEEVLAFIFSTPAEGPGPDDIVVWSADLSDVDFQDNTVYNIIGYGRDGGGRGPSTVLPFVFDQRNEGPGQPTGVSPSTSEGTTQPTFTWRNVTDPEGDDFTYELTIFLDDTDGEAAVTVSGIEPEEGNETSFTGPTLPEDRTLLWQVRGIDARGGFGDPSDALEFTINVRNNPPSSPVLIEPIARTILDEGDGVTFSWENAKDPEGDAVSYRLEIFADTGLPLVGAIEVEESDDGTGVTTFTFPDTIGAGGYSWTVEAVTEDGNALSNSDFFSVKVEDFDVFEPPNEDGLTCDDYEALGLDAPAFCAGELEPAVFPEPFDGCGCTQAPARPTPTLPLALIALAMAAVAVIRR